MDINQRNLKISADVADKICFVASVQKIRDWDLIFGRAVKAISSPGVRSPCFGTNAWICSQKSLLAFSTWTMQQLKLKMIARQIRQKHKKEKVEERKRREQLLIKKKIKPKTKCPIPACPCPSLKVDNLQN